MARTVSLSNSKSSPSSDGDNNSHADNNNHADGGCSDSKVNNQSYCKEQMKMGSGASRTSSSAFALPPAIDNQTIRNMSNRYDDNDDYVRASSTGARMPTSTSSSSRRDDTTSSYKHEYYADRNSSTRYRYQGSWNSSAGGRDNYNYHNGRGRGGRGGQYHASSRQQQQDYNPRPYYDDGNWGRERGGGWNNNRKCYNNQPYHNNNNHHQHFDDRGTRGDRGRGRSNYSERYYDSYRNQSPPKRRKYNHRHQNNNSNNNGNDMEKIEKKIEGRLKKEFEEKMEKKYHKMKQEMEDKLKKEVEDLKKSSTVVLQQPSSIVQQHSVRVSAGMQNDNLPNVGMQQQAQERNAEENNANSSSSNSGTATTSPQSPIAISVGSSSIVVAQQSQQEDAIPNNMRVDNEIGTPKVNTAQLSRLQHVNNNATSLTRTLNDDNDPSYDVSTDEDIVFPHCNNREENEEQKDDDDNDTSPVVNNGQEDEVGSENDAFHHESSEDTDKQQDNGMDNTSGGTNEDFGDSGGAWSDTEENNTPVTEENTNTQPSGNNSTNANEEIEGGRYTNRDSESNVTNNDSTGNNTSNQSDSNTNSNTNNDDSDEDSVDLVLQEDYDVYDGNLAFCCLNCRCWETSQTKFCKLSSIRNNCGNSGGGLSSGNTNLYHKGCCHGDKVTDTKYLSPITKAINEILDDEKKKVQPMSSSEAIGHIKRSYDTAKREETKFENDEACEDNMCSNHTNIAYADYCKSFQQRPKSRSPLRVLDLFSGIGSGCVVLKRLGLPIDTIVHCEHDPVAVEVCKYNHNNDGINHVYLETFEEIYGTNDKPDDAQVKAIVDKFGPIDLVLSGAPCQNYSGLNASRDQSSNNAQYLKKVGWLCKKLDEIQQSINVKENVLFLSENVVFKDKDEVNACYTDQEDGLTPICVDAKDFGPVKRNRLYWMNIPIENSAPIKEVAFAVSVDSLLEEGYGSVARLVAGGDEDMIVKSNALLASASRIDDRRMVKYKKPENAASSNAKTRKYKIETYSVCEREKMMGLPVGYVQKPLRKLFDNLTQNAFLLPENSEEGKTYREFLSKDLWHFRKKCHFKCKPNADYPFFQLAISSPLEGKSQLSYYLEDQYCKHCIGNGWSIPVVEHMLGKLKDLFPDNMMTEYDGYTYKYQWEPYLSM